jgi:hypothetical protein
VGESHKTTSLCREKPRQVSPSFAAVARDVYVTGTVPASILDRETGTVERGLCHT